MKETYAPINHSDSITSPKIFGYPERLIYRLGVLLFYAVLFVLISFFSKEFHSTVPDSPQTGVSVMGR